MGANKPGFALLLIGLAAGCGDGGSRPPAAGGDNAAPTIDGAVATAAPTGTPYSFRPEAQDADADRLAFSIRNKPAWAGFDVLTGELSGTPGERDVGLTNGVEISVTDGRATTLLPSFNLEVVFVEPRNLTLSWAPPVENADGSPLLDLAGFRIYYGSRRGEFPFVIEVDNPGLTAFVVENLAPGRYFFATTALDGSGNESPMSEVIEVIL